MIDQNVFIHKWTEFLSIESAKRSTHLRTPAPFYFSQSSQEHVQVILLLTSRNLYYLRSRQNNQFSVFSFGS